jgi:acyl carrier protein phosphodiesterase
MSLLLFTSQIKKSDKHIIGCLIGSMNYQNISKCNFDNEVYEGVVAFKMMNQYMIESSAFSESVSYFMRKFRHSELMVKMLFDHFYAKKWSRYHSEGYQNYIGSLYEKLMLNPSVLPYSIKKLVPGIVNNKLFSRLHTLEGFHNYLKFMIGIHKMSPMINYNLADCLDKYDLLSQNFEILYEAFVSVKWEENFVLGEQQELMIAS